MCDVYVNGEMYQSYDVPDDLCAVPHTGDSIYLEIDDEIKEVLVTKVIFDPRYGDCEVYTKCRNSYGSMDRER